MWTFETPSLSSHPLNHNIVVDPFENLLYIAAATKSDYQTFLLVVSATDGKILKNITMDAPKRRVSGNPVAYRNKDKTYYAIGGYPNPKSDDVTGVFTVEIQSGKRVWSVIDNSTEDQMNVYNIAMFDNTLIFQRDGIETKTFLGADMTKPVGTVSWTRYCERDSPITVDNDGYAYVLFDELIIKKLDRNGKDVVTFSLPSDQWVAFHDSKLAVNIQNGHVHMSATDNSMIVYMTTFVPNGTLLWSTLVDRTPYTGWTFTSDPVVSQKGDSVYMISTDENWNNGIVYEYDTATGDAKWKLILPTDSKHCVAILAPCSGSDNYILLLCYKKIHMIEKGQLVKTFSNDYDGYYSCSMDSMGAIYCCGNLVDSITGTMRCQKFLSK
jgi:outer membrane protein assembly factor BamB